MSEIIEDDEFKKLLPPLDGEERTRLMVSLEREGCRDRLVVWKGEGILVDGYNRYEICLAHQIPFDIIEKEFESREDVIEWIIKNQLGRRNLLPAARVEIALRLKPMIAERAKAKRKKKAAESGLATSPESTEPPEHHDTRQEIADEAGVGTNTVAKVESVLRDGDDETKADMRAGKVSINKAHEKTQQAKGPPPPREPEPEMTDGDEKAWTDCRDVAFSRVRHCLQKHPTIKATLIEDLKDFIKEFQLKPRNQ